MITTLKLYRKMGKSLIPITIEYDESKVVTLLDLGVSSRSDPKLSPVSKLSKAYTATKALVSESKAVIQQEPAVTPEAVEERLSICGGCELFIKEKNKCSSCGCYMKFKARLRSSHCPVGKW
jgi:hypothetical protein